MALQPKSYKKFVATAATAALVASAVAPAASANVNTAAFTDVSNAYEDAIEYLVVNNITKGYSETEFGVTRNIKRGDAAIILANALGINDPDAPASGFVDVPTRGVLAINSLKAAGVVGGKTETTFDFDANITRGEMALLLARTNAYNLTGDVSALPFTDVNNRYEEAVAGLLKAGITLGKTATTFGTIAPLTRGEFALFIYRAEGEPPVVAPVVESVSALDNVTITEGEEVVLPQTVGVTYDDETTADVAVSWNTDEFDFSVAGTYELTGTIEGTELTASVNVVVEAAVPGVASVTAINANEIVVNFNVELRSADAIVLENYVLDNTAVDNAELSADGKSVTLTVDNGVEGTDRLLVVSPIETTVKDADGAWVTTEKHSKILSYTDTVSPVVTSTSYTDGAITLAFSEKLSAPPTVLRVNNVPVVASDYSIVDGNKVVITKWLNASETASLYVAGAIDNSVAENEMAIYNGSVTAPSADMEKPRVTSVQVTGQNTAKVTLSEDIVEDNVEVILQKGSTQTPAQLVRDSEDTTGKTYTLTVDGLFPAGSTSTSEAFTLYVEAGVMADLANLKNEFYSTSVTFVKDTTAPTLSSTRVTAGNEKLEFLFNEGLVVEGATSQITIRNSQGVNFTAVAGESFLKTAGSSSYLVDFKADETGLDAGTYTVTFPAGFFTDAQGNETAAVSSTIVVPGTPADVDNEKPSATVDTSGTNEFTVAYNEEVSSNALSASSYRLDGQALPAGTDIYFTDSDKEVVMIELPEGSVNIGNQTDGAPAVLTLLNTTDLAGNMIDTTNYTVTIKDNTAATISSVQVAGDVVVVTFTEAVAVPSTDANDVFNVAVAGSVADAGNLQEVEGNESQVKFTPNTAPTGSVSTTVKAGQMFLNDENGVAVK